MLSNHMPEVMDRLLVPMPGDAFSSLAEPHSSAVI